MQIGNFLLKFNPASATGRNAYLLLVKTNFKGSALVPYRAQKDKKSKAWRNLVSMWKRIGGNPAKLDLAIQQGMKLHNRKHKNYEGDNFEEIEIDSFDPAIITASVAAVPVIISVVQTLKKSGVEVPESYTKAITDSAQQGAAHLAKEQGLKPDANGNYTISNFGKVPQTEGNNSVLIIGVVVVVAIAAFVYLSKNHK